MTKKTGSVEIKKGIYWVGGIDPELKEFHGYLTQRGSTYNAYLIVDEKVVLVDTVKVHLYDEMISRIKTVIDPAKIDYIVSNHTEMDHSGSLPDIIDSLRTNKADSPTIITSPNGKKGLKKHFHDTDWKFKVVNTGDSINIGKRNLQFILTQMVHWPDSMVTYVPEDKLLLSNDAFGQHIASDERYDDELDENIVKEEATKYYANIVMPYGMQVSKALDAVGGLEIDMIAPSHGVIWRKGIKDIIDLYKRWSADFTEGKAVIVYDTMWGSTEKIARTIEAGLEQKGIPAEIFSLKDTHISDIMTHVLTAKYICVGSPTLNNNMMSGVAAFLTYLKGLSPKNRIGIAFGSYGWGGQSIGQIEDMMSSCGFNMTYSAKVQWVPDKMELEKIKNKIKNI